MGVVALGMKSYVFAMRATRIVPLALCPLEGKALCPLDGSSMGVSIHLTERKLC